MEFDNAFEVPLPPEQAWPLLMDIRRIAPCMPGARLTEVVDERTYKGDIAVRLGPVALTFSGTVVFEHIDNEGRNARVKAQGNDAKGRGAANASSTFRLEPAGSGSKVLVHTDLTLSGAVAQYGRGVGMIQATAAALMNQFAGNLRNEIAKSGAVDAAGSASAAAPASPSPAAADAAADGAPPPAAKPTESPATGLPAASRPISGLALIWSAIGQRLRSVFGGRGGR